MKQLVVIVAFFILVFTQIILANTAPVIGIIVAVPDEAKAILCAMQHKFVEKRGVYNYTVGHIKHKKVVLVIGGAGIINTAVTTANLIHYFNPNMIIFSGTAGGVRQNLKVGDVVVSKKAYLLDVGNPNYVVPSWPNFPPHPVKKMKDPVRFLTNISLLNRAKKINNLNNYAFTKIGNKSPAKIIIGVIATSSHFPNSNSDIMRMKNLKVDAVAMEIASMMKVCWIYDKACIGFRGVSNILVPSKVSTKYTMWNKQNEILAANNSGKAVVKFIGIGNVL